MEGRNRTLDFSLALALLFGLPIGWEQGFALGQKPSAPAAQSQPAYEKLLSVAEVEQVTGFQGLKLIPRDPRKGAGGDLNFAKADGTVVLVVSVLGLNDWRQSKEQGVFADPVSGLGDEAYDGPRGMDQQHRHALFVRKGNRAVGLGSFIDRTQFKPGLSQAKLRELAKLILPRL
jgi:hypothetical protein